MRGGERRCPRVMERAPTARARDREKLPAAAGPEAGTAHKKAWAAGVPAAGRAREAAKVPAVVKAEAQDAAGVHNQFISALPRKWLAKR